MPKKDLVSTAKQYKLLEAEVPKVYVDRNPNRNRTLFSSVSTSCTRDVKAILSELNTKFSCMSDAAEERGLVSDTLQLFADGLFDNRYDNISRVTPELNEALI